MSDVQISHNELQSVDAELARRFEAEIHEAAQALKVSGDCRIVVERAADAALERVTVVLTRPEGVVEFRMALPAVPGDVRRAAESALLGRHRTRVERRKTSRAKVDRRR
jgi:hypothetical protein